MQGNIPGITIRQMPGRHPAAAAASRYRMPDDEDGFITLATAGIYPGEADELFQGKILSTNPIGMLSATPLKLTSPDSMESFVFQVSLKSFAVLAAASSCQTTCGCGMGSDTLLMAHAASAAAMRFSNRQSPEYSLQLQVMRPAQKTRGTLHECSGGYLQQRSRSASAQLCSAPEQGCICRVSGSRHM